MKLWAINEKMYSAACGILSKQLLSTVNLSQGREKKLKKCMKTGGLQKDFVILQMF